jgi:hypothetical protein
MSNGVMRVESNLPSKIEDLAQFVLVGRDKLAMVRAGIKALDKLDVAEGVRQQKKEEAQMLAEALLDAEVKIGEILARMPKASGKHWENKRESKILTTEESTFEAKPKPIETKQEAATKLGFNKQQVERFQTLAANKEIVEQIKQEARENDDLATRTAVLQVVKEKEKERKEIDLLDSIKNKKPQIEINIGDEWYTPKWLFNSLGIEFDIDVCSPIDTTHSNVPAKKRFNIYDNGLDQDWEGLVWCNPPYSDPEPWADKMIKHNNGIMLASIPMNALWASKVWQSCTGLRLFQAMIFVRPNGVDERPALWLQMAAFGEQAAELLKNMTKMPENPRQIPSPFFIPHKG